MIKKGILPQLAEVGKIKIGRRGKEVTSKNNKKFRLPEKVDHFIITTTERDAENNLIQDKAFTETLSNKTPRELPIRLPFDSIDKNFFTQYQFYTSSRKACSGDGEKAVRIMSKDGKVKLPFDDGIKEVTVKAGDHVDIKCDPETCPFFNPESGPSCKVSGILSAFLPGSKDLGGVYKFRTHSYNSVSSILGALEYFKANTGGILQGLPLKLVMVKKTTEEHGNIDYVTIVIDGEEIAGLRRKAIEEKQSRLLLGTDIDAIERQAEISGFFKDSDPEDAVFDEFYQDGKEDPAGVSAEEVEEEISSTEPEIEPDPKSEDESGKRDLF